MPDLTWRTDATTETSQTWALVNGNNVVQPEVLSQMSRLELRVLGVHLEEVMRVVQTALDTSYSFKVDPSFEANYAKTLNREIGL